MGGAAHEAALRVVEALGLPEGDLATVERAIAGALDRGAAPRRAAAMPSPEELISSARESSERHARAATRTPSRRR